MNNKQLYQISKYSYQEAYLQSQLNMAGSNLSNITEKMEKNKNYLKSTNIMTKIVMVVYVSLLIFLPISVFQNISITIDLGNDAWALLLGSSIMGGYFLVQVLYMLMFGLFYITGLFSGEAFHWLSTLPLKKDELGKISIWTFFRSVDAPIIALMLVFPIATLLVTQNILIFVVSALISALNTVFAFSLLIIIGKKFTNLVKSADASSKKNKIIQISYYILYMVVTFVAVLGFQFGMPAIEPLFSQNVTNLDMVNKISIILPWVPFPLSGGSLLTGALIGFENIPTLTIISSICGLVLFGLFDIFLVKRATRVLRDIIYSKKSRKEKALKISTIEDVDLTIITPMQSYRSKDIQSVGRDFQALMMILLPLILPTLAYLVAMSMDAEDPEGAFATFIIIMILYGMMGGFMLTLGLLNLESTGSTITSALPIINREQAKSKLQIMISISILSNIIPGIFLLFKNPMEYWYLIYLGVIPLCALFTVLMFLLKVRLFGKLNYKYVLEEVNLARKSGKLVAMGGIAFVLALAISIGIVILISESEISIVMLFVVLLAGELGIGYILFYIFNKMFPKPKIYQQM